MGTTGKLRFCAIGSAKRDNNINGHRSLCFRMIAGESGFPRSREFGYLENDRFIPDQRVFPAETCSPSLRTLRGICGLHNEHLGLFRVSQEEIPTDSLGRVWT